MQCADILCGIFVTVFAIFAVVLMSVVCILSGCVAYASKKNMVNLFIFHLVFSLIYFFSVCS